jgi:hypothetical protein
MKLNNWFKKLLLIIICIVTICVCVEIYFGIKYFNFINELFDTNCENKIETNTSDLFKINCGFFDLQTNTTHQLKGFDDINIYNNDDNDYYFILESYNSVENLSKAVNYEITNGYYPSGNIEVVFNNHNIYYYQAMIKIYNKEDKK